MLLEQGVDPISRQKDTRNAEAQTTGFFRAKAAPADESMQDRSKDIKDIVLPGGMAVDIPKNSSPAAQVLRLAVGLLGMEVHKEPSNWSEVWLTYKERALKNADVKSCNGREEFDSAAKMPFEDPEDAPQWQLQLLQQVRGNEPISSKSAASPDQHEPLGKVAQPQGLGKDATVKRPEQPCPFNDHLELAEKSLRKITHAVGVLQGANDKDRPLVMRGSGDDPVLEVASDLRQWLEQLSTLLSLQHVQVLDLEEERSRLEQALQSSEAKLAKAEDERRHALIERDRTKEWWGEMKLKNQMQSQLGVSAADPNPAIYSQKDLDATLVDYYNEHCLPLMDQLQAQEGKRKELMDRIAEKDKAIKDLRAKLVKEPSPEPTITDSRLPKAVEQLVVASLNGVAEHVPEEAISKLLLRISDNISATVQHPTLEAQSAELQQILAEIHAHVPEPPPAKSKANSVDLDTQSSGGEPHPATEGLRMVSQEFENLAGELRNCPVASGADRLAHLAVWGRDTVNLIESSVNSKEKISQPLQLPPPPMWDLGALNKKTGGIRTVAVNTEEAPVAKGNAEALETMRQQLEAEFEERMRLLREELERQLQLAQEAARKAKEELADALRKLAEETVRAEKTLTQLQRKMLSMQNIMTAKGFGEAAAEAVQEAGLTDFLTSHCNVYERLYRDALDRMQRLADMQAKIFEQTSEQYLRNINEFCTSHIALPDPLNNSERRSILYQDASILPLQGISGEGRNSQLIEHRKPRASAFDRMGSKPDCREQNNAVEPSNLLDSVSVLQLLEESSSYSLGQMREGSEEPRRRKMIALRPVRSPPPEPSGDFDLNISSFWPRNHVTDASAAAKASRLTGYPTVAAASRPIMRPVASKVPGALAEDESLPKLECRGQGKSSGNAELDSPLKQLQKSQSHPALPMGSVLSALPLARSGQGQLLSGIEPLLTVGSLGLPGTVAAPPVKPLGKLQRPLLAVRSAPQLPPGPSPMPRLLMQGIY